MKKLLFVALGVGIIYKLSKSSPTVAPPDISNVTDKNAIADTLMNFIPDIYTQAMKDNIQNLVLTKMTTPEIIDIYNFMKAYKYKTPGDYGLVMRVRDIANKYNILK